MRTAIHLLSAFFLLGAIGISQEVESVTVAKKGSGEAWLGLGVSKPDDTTTTQLPALPPGIGFVVSVLDEEGPAAKAGVRKLDLLWKMGEQMLVNEGQFATLLRLSRPGDEVIVSVFREGKSLDLKVKLGEAKLGDDGAIRRMLADSVMRRDDGALRTVNLEEKTVMVANEMGSAEVTRVDDGDAVRIVDTSGKVIFEAVVRGRPELSSVPDAWRRHVCAMRRGLEHALTAQPAPLRQPRPRIVPPSPQGEKQEERSVQK